MSNLVVTSSESIKLNTLNFNIRIQGFTSNKRNSSRMRIFLLFIVSDGLKRNSIWTVEKIVKNKISGLEI